MLPSAASIVLCTYQGQRYLAAQLASLQAQTVPPAEVIVQDDASTDETLRVLEQNSGSLAQVLKVHKNSARLGFAANFASALEKASKEVIFFCDQDDIWEPNKIETILRLFEDPAVMLAFHEVTLVSEDGKERQGSLLERNGYVDKAAFPFFLRKNPVPGMAMAIRSSFRSSLLPIPADWEHDYWALLLASGLEKKIAFERKSLALYRQHEQQAVGSSSGISARWSRASGKGLSARALEAQRMEALLHRLQREGSKPAHLEMASEKHAHLLRRGHFSSFRPLRALEIARELSRGGYSRYDAGLSSAIKDLLASS